jgi:N-methylhydantoinase A/oxoprolinase/acetone carboxylase beta subunit
MTVLLGIDTGGTYTDAVLLDADETRVLASAKALTSRPALALGVGAAMDAVLAESGVVPAEVGLVSLSTTLATNALVEGQGGRVALIALGFDARDLERDGLAAALAGDPLIQLAGGHSHTGAELAALDPGALQAALQGLPAGLTGVAVAGRFATRNPGHEIAVRDMVRARTGLPVTCSHELSAALGGPRRALTAVLNARLIGMIARLIDAVEGHMARRGIGGRLMVVRGDGALIPATLAREKPVETILSGPAASIAGAAWLTGLPRALVSDIGGTTTDICLLQDGRPRIDPEGARVGPWRTMVQAVAMRTWGLGGDSAVSVTDGLDTRLRLGPRRLMPVSLIAAQHPEMVHRALDAALAADPAPEGAGRFLVPVWAALPEGLDPRAATVAERLSAGPLPWDQAVRSRLEGGGAERLISRGLVLAAGVTPSDAAHVLDLSAAWDADAARKALTLFARRRNGRGDRLAADAAALARLIVAQLREQTADCLIEAGLAEGGWSDPAALSRHPLMLAARAGRQGPVRLSVALDLPVVGLGASAPTWYPPLAEALGTKVILPEHAGVANAIGAVVGRIAMTVEGTVTAPGPGLYLAHLPEGPRSFADEVPALAALEAALSQAALNRARAAGVETPRVTISQDIRTAEVEGQRLFIEARLTATAEGRPSIAHPQADDPAPPPATLGVSA